MSSEYAESEDPQVLEDSPLAAPVASRPFPRVRGIFSFDRVFIAGLCIASVGFFAVAFSISLKDPDYFSRQAISSLPLAELDPIMTGAIVEAPEAIPVPRVVRAKPLVPADYQIVMVFENEAILATSEELWRVKIGSVVPGLGEVLQIEPNASGGVVKASQATLRTVAH